MSKSKLTKTMFLFAVFLLSIIPLWFSIAQTQEDTWTTQALTPTPTIEPTPTSINTNSTQQQIQLLSTPEIVFIIIVGVFGFGLIVNLANKRRS